MNNQNDSDLQIRREIQLGEALDRLKINPDFQMVIVDEVITNTLLKGSQSIISPEPVTRNMVIEEIIGVNMLRDKLARMTNAKEVALQQIAEGE